MKSLKNLSTISIYTYLFTFLFCYTTYAQKENTSVEYQDPTSIIEEMKTETGNLIKSNKIILKGDQAEEQLFLASNKIISLDLPEPKKDVLTSEKIFNEGKKSTLIIGYAYLCNTCDKTHMGNASGYTINEDGIFITNYHVVKSYTNIKFDKKAFVARTADGKIYQVKNVLSASKDNDVAILELETNGDKLTPMSLGAPAPIGASAFVISHPSQIFYYFTKGMVSRNDMRKNDDTTQYVMSITADYAKGSSGGPVIDIYGNAIGTVSSTHSYYANQSKQKNLQMVTKNTVPVIVIKELLQSNEG